MEYKVFKTSNKCWKDIKKTNVTEFFISFYENRFNITKIFKRKYKGIASVYMFKNNEIKIPTFSIV